MDAERIEAVVLEAVAVAAASNGASPVVFRGLPLGPGGTRADLAIVADEFIGVSVRGSGDGLDGIGDELAAYARYFDRVALATPRPLAERVRLDAGSPAALWIAEEGRLVELRPGRAGRATVGGYFDLMTVDERRRVLARLTGLDPARARGPGPSIAQVRNAFAAAVSARG